MNKPPVVCLDSNVFLSFLRGDEPESNLCRQVMEEAQRGEISTVTSVLALVETVYLASLAPDEAEQEIARLFRARWLTVYDLTWPIAEEASRLARRYPGGKRNSPHDCVYVATALFAGAPLVFTLDDHFIRRFASNTEGITVELPHVQGVQPKFDF